MEKPFYKRWWFLVIVIVFIYGAIASMFQSDEEEQNTEVSVGSPTEQEENAEDETKVEPEELEEEPEEMNEKVIELSDELLFAEFTINFEELSIEENKAILTYSWINQAGDGKKFFFALAGLDVMQDDNKLDEISGAFDAENRNTSDMYFPNAEGGRVNATLEYELVDAETPIDITVVPYNDFNEDSQTITIAIK